MPKSDELSTRNGSPTKTTSLEVNAPLMPTKIQLIAYKKPDCISIT